MKVNKQGVYDSVYLELDMIKVMDDRINAKIAERDQLLTLATSCTANMDGMPHASGKSDRVGNIAVKLADLGYELDRLIDQYVDHKRMVISKLEKLPHDQYMVMHKHYVQGKSWKTVADEMGYDRTQVWRLKVKSLQSLKDATPCNINL